MTPNRRRHPSGYSTRDVLLFGLGVGALWLLFVVFFAVLAGAL